MTRDLTAGDTQPQALSDERRNLRRRDAVRFDNEHEARRPAGIPGRTSFELLHDWGERDGTDAEAGAA